MKYRRLSQEELEPLKEEFLKYLLVANITPERWEKMKAEKDEKCKEHLDIFSDLVFEKILDQIQFIDRILPQRIELYQCQKEQCLLYALEAKDGEDLQFDKDNLESLDLSKLHCIQGKKTMGEDRKKDIFDLLHQEHAYISDGALFKRLVLLLAN